jgi:hypothetical protein
MFARSMSTGDYLAGTAFFLPTIAATLGAAFIVVRKRYGYVSGLSRLLAFCVVATAALVFAHVLPAALGVLTRGTPLVASLILLAAAWFIPAGREAAAPDPITRPPASGVASIAIAASALAAVVVYELARLRLLVGHPLTHSDMLGFHLPGVARWIQTGTVWQVDQFVPGFATAQYPGNGDFIILSTILPWHDLAFARFPAVLFFALTGVAVYALALELGATRAAATTFAAAALVVPALSTLALEGMPDVITLSMLAIGSLFLIRHNRTSRTGELVLAGLALGLALGTKWYGLTAGAVLAVVWVAAQLIARARLARVARDGGVLLSVAALGGGFWLVRNLVESGNPLYPKTVSIFGVQLFAGSHNDIIDRFGYTIANYLGKPSVLRKYIFPGFKMEMGIAALVLIAGLAVGIGWSLRALRGAQRRHTAALVLAVAIAVLGICATYVITPGSAYGTKDFPVAGDVNIRWLMPAVVLGAAVCASAAGKLGRWGVVLELAGLAAVAHGIKLGPGVELGAAAKVAVALALVSAAALLAVRSTAAVRRRASPAAWLAAAAVAVVALVAVGRIDQRSFDRHSYASDDPVFAWIDAHAPAGHGVGLTGAVDVQTGLAAALPAFGPRLGNRVTYVGDVVRHSMALPTRKTGFRAELREGRHDLLMIGLSYAGHTEAWARELGYRLIVRSKRIALYAAPGTPL